MSENLMNALCDANAILQPREDYSGRAMYGKETCGVVYSRLGDLLEAVARLDEPLSFADELARLRTDNMGRDMIAY